ncbi:unnamed protein product [Oppiella nova]|uniref:Uncharacterized protein n=1 Tax=Oppiella nova TaxID=334625 RepID=A0A7R9QP95_9ACAR|nr:unnamed protein product [Oppiella nova]CAG2168892.1 unnamed protein product [Oppiella nova]
MCYVDITLSSTTLWRTVPFPVDWRKILQSGRGEGQRCLTLRGVPPTSQCAPGLICGTSGTSREVSSSGGTLMECHWRAIKYLSNCHSADISLRVESRVSVRKSPLIR